jgi:P-type conjugative transfer protein TrbJ
MTAKQQLDDMVQNTKQLTRFNWDDAQGTITQLLGITNTIDGFKNQLGSFDKFLGQFQVIDYYRNLPCIGANSCTVAGLAKLAEIDRLSSEARKKANDALFRCVDQQQQTLQKDSAHLRELQQAAQSSTGRLQALQAANELASEQTNQPIIANPWVISRPTKCLGNPNGRTKRQGGQGDSFGRKV